MLLHDFHSRVEQSGSKCPVFKKEILQQLFPEVETIVSVESGAKNMPWQEKGVDYILYNSKNEIVATLDKKERGTWRGGHNVTEKPKVFDDVALEIVSVSNPSLSPMNLKNRADFWKKEFVSTLRHKRDLTAVIKCLQARTEEGESVGPGWSTKDKSLRTVDATLYIIGPLGKAYLLNEKELQRVIIEELPRWIANKNRSVISMRGTASIDRNTGRLWAVSNFGVPVALLRKHMDIPQVEFMPYDINKTKNEKDTLIKSSENKNGTDLFLNR